MKILVTGHKGYLGSKFLEKYSNKFEILGYDISNGEDLLDIDNLKNKMTAVEQVVHLAAIPKPDISKSFSEYFKINVEGTKNVALAAEESGVRRIIYASSTTVYGIERGIPFTYPIKENQAILSQYIKADQLNCREADLSYLLSKVMAEQIMAWYGLNKKVQTVSLRFGPIGKVFLGTSVSAVNAVNAIYQAIINEKELWYEPFSIVDKESEHIDISRAKEMLGYDPEPINYTQDQIHSTLADRYAG